METSAIKTETSAPAFRQLAEVASSNDTSVGGKAFNLALLEAQGFPVPEGLVLNRRVTTPEEWNSVLSWWRQIGCPPLAARSSAQGEDSGNASFAGQLSSVLGIDSEDALKKAIETCFASIDRAASRAYRTHFGHKLAGMNVLVQRMIEPAFSGVYFSRDPRGGSSWLVEAIKGLGENLVSGHETPMKFSAIDEVPANLSEGWKKTYLAEVVAAGAHIKSVLGFEADIEWAIDKAGKLWILQARPITTGAKNAADAESRIQSEMTRLKATFPASTVWDGQTFAEWTGLPSPLSFSIWQRAFSSSGAFLNALRELGYEGRSKIEGGSLLDLLFGRAYLNLNRLEPEFFGRIPYVMRPTPRPHLEFDWRRIDFPTILHAPAAISRMIAVAHNVQGRHGQFLRACEAALSDFRAESSRLPALDLTGSAGTLAAELNKGAVSFADQALKWPFILAMLTDSALGSLETVLSRDVGRERAAELVRKWMGSELSTVTSEMDREFQRACVDKSLRPAFLETYGHRGPGELDLQRARWRELGDAAFYELKHATPSHAKTSSFKTDLEEKVHALRRPYVQLEWTYLKSLLELRERWKMEIMKPYFRLRKIALALGEQLGLKEDIFWLRLEETYVPVSRDLKEQLQVRKADGDLFRKISLPVAFSLTELQNLIAHRNDIDGASDPNSIWKGEPLSPGLVSGVVRIVRNMADLNMSDWPDNVVIVAEATDPGWTPVFQQAVAIVVEKGGVLSHCAIVAREMGLPAVSQILGCTKLLKDGDHVWVDGNLGRVAIARSH